MQRIARLHHHPTVPCRLSAIGSFLRRRWDFVLITLLLIGANRALLDGAINTAWIYHPLPVGAGQWWRPITYPLVHLSWYHLVLDAGAFYFLYNGLETRRGSARLMLVAACSAASLLFGAWLGTAQTIGLAGLSGIDHGLMAVLALQMLRSTEQRNLGFGCLALVVGKSVYELSTGDVVFAAFHNDWCGTPVAAAHAGGVLGGVLAYGMQAAGRAFRNHNA